MRDETRDALGSRGTPDLLAGNTLTATSAAGSLASPTPPAIALPKGGGAIRGMGEKVAVEMQRGTGTASVPIATSPARSGFGPRLQLVYDSASGNGSFGLGWQLSIPSVSRKTDKGLPRYEDGDESDIFLLAGADDLVPALRLHQGRWEREVADRVVDGQEYAVHRYRPRTEAAFTCIERWTRRQDGVVHWRTLSRDNVTTIFGATPDSRLSDPVDPARVYSWLSCASYDDRGNAIAYRYKPEDLAGVDPAAPAERHRFEAPTIANRYLKSVRYGNRLPAPVGADLAARGDWLFEVVLDYGEHHPDEPTTREIALWRTRPDPFSTYRAGFEIRTYRLCRRILMFHHFPEELGVADCLVRSTDLVYRETAIASFLGGVTAAGYARRPGGGYTRAVIPTLELGYTPAELDDTVRSVEARSLEHLPAGVDGLRYQWVDLNGEGMTGVVTEQADGWWYKANRGASSFAPLERLESRPAAGGLGADGGQLVDLAGDGQVDWVAMDPPLAGFAERTRNGWAPLRPFTSFPTRALDDPRVRLLDLTGDGRPDLMIAEDDAVSWHPSLGEGGFGDGRRVTLGGGDRRAPQLLFADATESLFLADMSGDGLSDLLRVRNGEVCYWPNLGYGRFGAKVTMAGAPTFDHPEQFDRRRLRLVDVDGSGVADLIYLGPGEVRVWFNQAGNGWSEAHTLPFPAIDNLAAVTALDLLGTGTTCLVWSSPRSGEAGAPLRYVDLLGGRKPHLLESVRNNLGAETWLGYAPSTRFYLADREAGRPWVTRLPFPVHVVERIETVDRIGRSRFVTRYAYHHGHWDGEEREFGGFGSVEQWDTERMEVLGEAVSEWSNEESASRLPPAVVRSWFHTGAWFEGATVSRQFETEYFREPAVPEAAVRALLLPDTTLPAGLLAEEEREACRTLRGSLLHQETYTEDDSPERDRPYATTERTYTVRLVQPRGPNRHAVFSVDPAETLETRTERQPDDPRLSHQLVLAVDEFGNVERTLAVAYPRRDGPERTPAQAETHMLLTVARFANRHEAPDWRRLGVPIERRTYEIVRPPAPRTLGTAVEPFTLEALRALTEQLFPPGAPSPDPAALVAAEFWDWRTSPAAPGEPRLRLMEHVRIRYRRDDLAGPLPLGEIESLALPYETYGLTLTPGLVAEVFGARVDDVLLRQEAGYVHGDGGPDWWTPSGRVFYSTDPMDGAAQELAEARRHFFLPRRFEDPFGHRTIVGYDGHDLLVTRLEDAAGNVMRAAPDYRVLQPAVVTDANGNDSAVAFDALGLVVATAVMGKPGEAVGDRLGGLDADLPQARLDAFWRDPIGEAPALLADATTRVVYDLTRLQRTADPSRPTYAATLARETHASDPPPAGLRIQVGITFSDGFGREVQHKVQAAPGSLRPGGPVVAQRWVGTGWTVFNNKGLPVQRFEPFFSETHEFEFARAEGVSDTWCYDPLGRTIATLHPDGSYEKVVFGPWEHEAWDASDTVLLDPRTDPHVGRWLRAPVEARGPGWRTWLERRLPNGIPVPPPLHPTADEDAALKAAAHARTPTTVRFDTLGRPYLALGHNGFDARGQALHYATEVTYDLAGNQRRVQDARGRIIRRAAHDLLGTEIWHDSVDAGARWVLLDVAGRLIRAWGGRGFARRLTYDALHRPLAVYVRDGESGAGERLAERREYGEAEGAAANHRGRLHRTFDASGVVENEAYDFKGNLVRAARRFLVDHGSEPDWNGAPALEPEPFRHQTRYDALNRPTQILPPHSDRAPLRVNVLQPGYGEAGHLERLDVWLARGDEPAALLDPGTASFRAVEHVDYDARGQRTLVRYGNGAVTTYGYDPERFRLTELMTRRPDRFDARTGDPRDDRRTAQQLTYTYDPVGNITRMRDEAQPTVFFRNQRVAPVWEYRYDPLYRLISAEGREHLGQVGGALAPPVQHDFDEGRRTGLPHPNEGTALGRYTEEYEYDEVGNLLRLAHRGTDPAHPGWTREYDYEPDPAEPARPRSNRLVRTRPAGPHDGGREAYAHDAHGNMTAMPHLAVLEWDGADQLRVTRRQAGDAPGPRTVYGYDTEGQRVRKVTERPGGGPARERRYLGGVEVYREYGADGAITLERETLHLVDDTRRLALVEARTAGRDGSPASLVRYQFGDHLGSCALELDDQAEVLSHEEHYPFGGTAYQAVGGQNAPPKRYRFTGKERDEESGLDYFGARYYAAWLGRWTSCDPLGMTRGTNLYAYVSNNPIGRIDPTGQQWIGLNIAPAIFREGPNVREPVLNVLPEAGVIPRQFQEFAFRHVREATWLRNNDLAGFANERIGELGLTDRGNALLGGVGFVGSPEGEALVAHTHPRGSPIPSNVDLWHIVESGQTEHVIVHERGVTYVRLDPTTRQGHFTVHNLDGTHYTEPVAAPDVHPLAGLAEGVAESDAPLQAGGRSVGSALSTLDAPPGTGFLARARDIGGRIKAGAGIGLKVADATLNVADAALGGIQVGTGLDQIVQGNVGLGAVDVAEGSANLGLSIGTTAAVKSGALVAEGGIAAGGVALAASIAAAASVGLAAETARAAVKGEETPLDVMDKAYGTHFGDIGGWISGRYAGQASSPGFGASLKQFWWQVRN
jgi:RHS repeat-associated protein